MIVVALTLPQMSAVTLLLCGELYGTVTSTLSLMTANCSDPLEQPAALDAADSVVALGYSTPGLKGHSIDFKCPPGLTLIGPNTSTCMRNGE